MSWTAIGSSFTALLKNLPFDKAKRIADAALDEAEKIVQESDTRVDDMIVLPLIQVIRRMVGITEEEGSPYEDKPDGSPSG